MVLNNEGYFLTTTYFFCVLFSVAPSVMFADIPEEDLFKSVVEQEQLVLSCEVSRADGVVQWYKDGTEIQPRESITMQAEDTKRNLTIHSAQLSDTGIYTCRAGDNVIMFKVTIRGNKVTYENSSKNTLLKSIHPSIVNRFSVVGSLRQQFQQRHPVTEKSYPSRISNLGPS